MNGDSFVDRYGTQRYFLNSKLHRIDGPAIEYVNGLKFWYLNDEKLSCPDCFETMEEFVQFLNDNEDYSLPWISDFNGLIAMIKNPTGKQTRLHAMRWKI